MREDVEEKEEARLEGREPTLTEKICLWLVLIVVANRFAGRYFRQSLYRRMESVCPLVRKFCLMHVPTDITSI